MNLESNISLKNLFWRSGGSDSTRKDRVMDYHKKRVMKKTMKRREGRREGETEEEREGEGKEEGRKVEGTI